MKVRQGVAPDCGKVPQLVLLPKTHQTVIVKQDTRPIAIINYFIKCQKHPSMKSSIIIKT